ncbi:hypothetical protein [Streptomyces sp. NPDC059165]|uniref:hypothetical protein n=1 Tax=Streptomyces sp. NPDC059165 TaxID=3346751 RepID=UPI0036B7F419
MSTSALEKVNGYAEPRFDPVELAEADAVRTEAEAKATALRIEAEGKAAAEKIKAAEEARKQKIANDKAEDRAREEQAAREARIAKLNRERAEEERAARDAEEKAAAEAKAEEVHAAEIYAAEEQWRKYALRFYAVCSVVALPVQIAAFYNPKALWLMAAPIMLEGGAWVVLKGARAAAASRRPHWHYRLIAWCLAFIAASINLWHGLHAFDPATAIGTAFASIAGPGVYDLHEHGQIRKRDGKLTWRQRRAQRAAERKAAVEKAAAEERAAAEREAKEKAAAERAEQLDAMRAEEFPEVWDHAVRLAAALGETTVTAPVWRRAHIDIEGAEPGESVDVIRGRNVAARRIAAARSEAPGNTPIKVTKAQGANQMPRTQRGPARKPPVRRKGDTQKYVEAARKQAAIAARKVAIEEQS